MRFSSRAFACLALLAMAVGEAAIAPIEDPDACLSTEQRAQLVQRGKELFFRGGGNQPQALAQANYREASEAHERALAEWRRCEASSASGQCSMQRERAAELGRRVASARAERAKRDAELADELTARARRMREEYPPCATPRG